MGTDKIKARHLDEEFVLPADKIDTEVPFDGELKFRGGYANVGADENIAVLTSNSNLANEKKPHRRIQVGNKNGSSNVRYSLN